MNTVTYSVPSIHCGHCVHTIQTELADVPGVSRVAATLDTKQVTVDFSSPADEAKIQAALREINYPVAA
jgi:copper chaperone CopZ